MAAAEARRRKTPLPFPPVTAFAFAGGDAPLQETGRVSWKGGMSFLTFPTATRLPPLSVVEPQGKLRPTVPGCTAC